MAYLPGARSVTLSLVALLFSTVPPLHADLTQEQVAAAKAATGLLVTSRGAGTAFCISESGLFVTCDHVIDNVTEGSITVVVSPAETDERSYPAKIVRRFKDTDLAILKVTADRKMPVLKLGDISGLFETEQVCGFGYPFGRPVPVEMKSYGPISVNVGRITSLRKKNGVLNAIDLDARVSPGNTGGPVLDPNGKVIGIVSSGVVNVGFAIPVSLLIKGMQTPVLGVAVPNADSQHRYEPVAFTISVEWLSPPVEEPKVSIELRGDGPPRRAEAQKGNDGKFRALIVPGREPEKTEKVRLQITLDFDGGKIIGTVEDRAVSIAGIPKPLHEIRTLRRAPNGTDFLADGKPAGPLPELKALALDVGGAAMTVDAQRAGKIEIQKPSTDLPAIFYKAVVVLSGGQEFSSDEKALSIGGSTAPTPPPVLKGKVNLTGIREISLPAPISDVAAAQDGRSLLLHLKESKKLAVFDVIDLKIRGYVDLDEDKILFAGGSRYILVVCPVENLIQRYSMETLQKERTIANSFGNITSLTMGRSSPGLAMIAATGDSQSNFSITAFDAESMTAISTADAKITRSISSPNSIIRASADGRTFGLCRKGSSPTGFTILAFNDNEFSEFYEHSSCGVLVPSADGAQIFTSQSGVFTNQFVPVVKSQGNWADGLTFLPSYHPMFFISVPYNAASSGREKKTPKTIGIYLAGSSQALLQMPEELKEMQTGAKGEGSRSSEGPITLDKRYHFFPQMELLLTIPPTNDKIVARPLNVRRLLDEQGIDYRYVTSVAPLGKVSTTYRYKLEAVSKAGGVEFTLQSGPKGLTVSTDGEVTWNAPARPVDETVIVSLKDDSGQEAFHMFRIVITQ
ncbi:MAG: serine protease Do [Chthoniobacter sp.]|jgi:hypothetical protein|nr:serine protease Do [Chthoniobacter sp.]